MNTEAHTHMQKRPVVEFSSTNNKDDSARERMDCSAMCRCNITLSGFSEWKRAPRTKRTRATAEGVASSYRYIYFFYYKINISRYTWKGREPKITKPNMYREKKKKPTRSAVLKLLTKPVHPVRLHCTRYVSGIIFYIVQYTYTYIGRVSIHRSVPGRFKPKKKEEAASRWNRK